MSEEVGGFRIQIYDDWADYPCWEYRRDAEHGDPLRFDTADDARAFLDSEYEKWFATAHAAWVQRKAAYDERHALFVQRKDCLIKHGLWKRDDESFVPILGAPGPGTEPARKWNEDSYRIVDMTTQEPGDDH